MPRPSETRPGLHRHESSPIVIHRNSGPGLRLAQNTPPDKYVLKNDLLNYVFTDFRANPGVPQLCAENLPGAPLPSRTRWSPMFPRGPRCAPPLS